MKKYFVSRVSNITAHNGLDLGSWEDGILDSDDNPQDRSTLYNERVYSMAWDNIWEWGKSERAYILANAGFKVCTYFQIPWSSLDLKALLLLYLFFFFHLE